MTPREQLTPREIQIARLVWEGLTNREISRIIGTTEQVIKNHLRCIFDKAWGLEPPGTGDVRGQPWRAILDRALRPTRHPGRDGGGQLSQHQV